MLLALGRHRFDIRHRPVVLAAVEPAVAVDAAAQDRRAGALIDALVRARPDALVVGWDDGGVDVSAMPAIEALAARIGPPLVVRTAQDLVARRGAAIGVPVLVDAPTADAAGAGDEASIVVAACIDRQPVPADEVARRLEAAMAAVPGDGRILLDAGAGVVGSASNDPLPALDALAALPVPVAVDVDPSHVGRSPSAVNATAAVAVARGARIVVARDVRTVRRAVDVTARLLAARARTTVGCAP